MTKLIGALEKIEEALEAWFQIRDTLELHDNYEGNLDALIMKLHPAQQGHIKSEWQPIETAPKDGRQCIIAIEGSSRAFLAQYNGEAWNTIHAGKDWTGHNVTHWMPLPKPPEGEA